MSRPTPGLDPGNIKTIDGFEEHGGYVQAALTAFDTAFKGIQSVIDARQKVARNASWTPDRQLIEVAALAEKRQDAALKAMDSAIKTLTQGIKSLDESLSKPLQAGTDNSISAEIRAHAKALSNEDRRALIINAMDKGDTKTLNAVLGAPAYLSGLDEVMQAHFTHEWNTKQTPEIAKRVDVMRRALELVNARGPLVLTQIEEAMGGRGSWAKVSAARLRDKEARAALA
jgi:hypothetical protein